MKQNKGSEKRFFNNKNKIKKKKERKGEKKKNATPLSSSCLLPFCVFVTSLGVCVFLEKFRTRQTGEKSERTGSKKRRKKDPESRHWIGDSKTNQNETKRRKHKNSAAAVLRAKRDANGWEWTRRHGNFAAERGERAGQSKRSSAVLDWFFTHQHTNERKERESVRGRRRKGHKKRITQKEETGRSAFSPSSPLLAFF